MLTMILKMSGITLLYILLVAVVWRWTKEKGLNTKRKIIIGIIFGMSSVMSTHFGVPYETMVVNVRDVGPLSAGLFFSPISGIIAGLIGGIERYIAGTYFGVGSYTTVACSLSTCLAGFVAWILYSKVFRGKKPSPFYAFFMGAVMEVFHMYAVFITHKDDMRMAFSVVSKCAVPMIVFSGIALAISSILLQVLTKEWVNPFKKHDAETISVSQKFQRWLFIITSIVIVGNFVFTFLLQTQSTEQNCKENLKQNLQTIEYGFLAGRGSIDCDSNVSYIVVGEDRYVISGKIEGRTLPEDRYELLRSKTGKLFESSLYGDRVMILSEERNGYLFVTSMMKKEVYWYRNAQAYELALADILLFTVIYVLVAFLVNQIVVNNIRLINASLFKITNGDLNEVVTVRDSSEFASLSDDINKTVLTLKGYIDAAEKRIEKELLLAKTIQESVLPKKFDYPERDEFELFASMNPAKEVGGDFYDFYFLDRDRLALVIADVTGKGIPASLFMMRSKTAIRSFAESEGTPEEIVMKANDALYEGNDAEMFVTAWIGIINLKTGLMHCVNAGHEYPVIKRAGGDYELMKDKHSLALAAMPGTKARGYELQFNPGDKIFVYTDGVAEAINEDVEQYGSARLVENLNMVKDKPVAETLSFIAKSLDEFKGEADQFDDITMMGFEYKKISR